MAKKKKSMRSDKMISEHILVIEAHRLPDEVFDEVCEEQSNGSYKKIYLKPADHHTEIKTREWLAKNGVKWDGEDDYQYVLFHVSW